jgi:hypothetical protein
MKAFGSTARNMEWEYSPYVGWSVDEADTCGCGSCLCADAEPVTVTFTRRESSGIPPKLKRDLRFEALLTYYRFKRWVFKPTPWKS